MSEAPTNAEAPKNAEAPPTAEAPSKPAAAKKAKAKAPYLVRAKGLVNPAFEFEREGQVLGTMRRTRLLGCLRLQGAVYEPVQGETITIQRDPGLLRSQFSAWSQVHGGQGREWLGSSINYGIIGREISLHNGTKPFRLIPSKTFGPGWELHAPKTGLTATFKKVSGGIEIGLERRVDFFLLLLAFHNVATARLASIWPGPDPTPPVI